jgi:serine/threonine-protein kinase
MGPPTQPVRFKALRQKFDVSVVSLGGDHRVTPLLTGTFNERSAELSPDGRWIAYQSDESGSDEVYVRPFPQVNQGRWPISINGGQNPMWAHNGRELFYIAPRGRLMAVTVRTTPTFVAERPIQLFEWHEPTTLGREFAVAPDGRRFLLLKDSESSATTQLIVVENWTEELKQRVPRR